MGLAIPVDLVNRIVPQLIARGRAPQPSIGIVPIHPDLVARLWDEITTLLPVDCRFVLFGTPVLMRPDSEIVFGFAGGTHTYALRLPDGVRAGPMSLDGCLLPQLWRPF